MWSMLRYAVLFIGFCSLMGAETPTPTPAGESNRPATASLEPGELDGFSKYPLAVSQLLEACLALTKRNLGYDYGSSDPVRGGMDCSGTIYYVLQKAGIKDVPRTASQQYVWARKADNFEAVISRKKDSFELDALRPGDLLFWTGTYSTDRDPPVTHTMIYLGKRKSDGKQVMFGASDGRTYDGRKIWGVSVFDFTITKAAKKSTAGAAARPGSVFIGYANIPGLDVSPN